MLQGVIYTYMLSSKIYVYTLQIICVIYMLCYIIYVYIIYTACDVMLCYVVYFIRIYIYVIFFCQCPGETEADSTSIHSWKGVFCIKERIRNETVLIHTGGVDAMWWRLSKSAIPCSLATRVNSQVNPKCEASGSGNGNG